MNAYATALKAYLEAPDRKQGALADKVGLSQPSIHRYATGERFPERDVAAKIDEATNGEVPIALWQTVALGRLGIEADSSSAEAA